jgi:two-component system, NarL family, response regulator LiaR
MPHCRIAFIDDQDPADPSLHQALAQEDKIEALENAAVDAEGLTRLEAYQPDVVVVEMDRPNLDGIEVTRRVKTLCNLKVLILTHQDDAQTVLDAFAAGADSYCMKDKPLSALINAIQATAQGQAWIDPAIANVVLSQLRQSYRRYSSAAAPFQSEELSTEDTYPYPLSDRELQVLQLIVDGLDNAAIAIELHIGIGTVKTHVRHIFSKLSVSDRTQAAVRALRLGLAQ